jgi:plasmid stability protein
MKKSLISAMNSMNDGRRDILSAALAQWEHPDFDKYLSAKIGMY